MSGNKSEMAQHIEQAANAMPHELIFNTPMLVSSIILIVTLTERLAEKEGKPSLAITPGLWFRKGTPIMLLTLTISSIIMYVFFDFYNQPLRP